MKKLKLGQVVTYNTTEADRKRMSYNQECNTQHKLPAVVTQVWHDGKCNLKVLLDGVGDIWKTSVEPGTSQGQFEVNEEPLEAIMPKKKKLFSK